MRSERDDPADYDLIARHLDDDVTIEEMREFEERRATDPAFFELTESVAQWALFGDDDIRDIDPDAPPPPADATETWDRLVATHEERKRQQRQARNGWRAPFPRPRLRFMINVLAAGLLGAGWVDNVAGPTFPGARPLVRDHAAAIAAQYSDLGVGTNWYEVETGDEGRDVRLPDRSTVLVRPGSQFRFPGDSAAVLVGEVEGEVVLDIPEGRSWRIDAGAEPIALGPGLYAIANPGQPVVRRMTDARPAPASPTQVDSQSQPPVKRDLSTLPIDHPERLCADGVRTIKVEHGLARINAPYLIALRNCPRDAGEMLPGIWTGGPGDDELALQAITTLSREIHDGRIERALFQTVFDETRPMMVRQAALGTLASYLNPCFVTLVSPHPTVSRRYQIVVAWGPEVQAKDGPIPLSAEVRKRVRTLAMDLGERGDADPLGKIANRVLTILASAESGQGCERINSMDTQPSIGVAR